MYPHRIRLRGPWECESLSARKTRFRRRFGCPTNLDSFERVWLTFGGIEGPFSSSLNGLPLGEGGEFDVTALLKPRNELVVELDGPTTDGRWGDVAMEIRRTAFFRDVHFLFTDSRLLTEGKIVGTSERPLEVYVILDRSTVAYGVFQPGTSFQLTSEPLTITGTPTVRVDLVDGATVWYTLERTFDLPS
jgi:hypothetical protein